MDYANTMSSLQADGKFTVPRAEPREEDEGSGRCELEIDDLILNALQEDRDRTVDRMWPSEIKGKMGILGCYPERVQDRCREVGRIMLRRMGFDPSQ